LIRTFIDTGVLIDAVRGEISISEKAKSVLFDSQREFVSSKFLKLEILPKAIYNLRRTEVDFYESFFEFVKYWANDTEAIIEAAYREAEKYGLGAFDALHVAAAVSMNAQEFITNEKPEKSIHRTKSIKVISLHSIPGNPMPPDITLA
jgi:predicted nucleic acid-binding protein